MKGNKRGSSIAGCVVTIVLMIAGIVVGMLIAIELVKFALFLLTDPVGRFVLGCMGIFITAIGWYISFVLRARANTQ